MRVERGAACSYAHERAYQSRHCICTRAPTGACVLAVRSNPCSLGSNTPAMRLSISMHKKLPTAADVASVNVRSQSQPTVSIAVYYVTLHASERRMLACFAVCN